MRYNQRMRSGFSKFANQKGLTLIEIMVVLAIVGGILAAIAPRLVNPKLAMKSAVREFATLTREIHNNARLFNSTYRLVIKMDPKEGHSYSLESSTGAVRLLTQEQKRELEFASSDQQERAEKKLRDQFSEDGRILKKPKVLPRGLFFESIEYGNREEVLTEGVAYIYFFPQGLAEEAVVHIGDRKSLNWTVSIHSITGKASIIDGKKSLKELRQP